MRSSGGARARGGSTSLRNLGESGLKARLRTGPRQIRPSFQDNKGNLLRSNFEVEVANMLAAHNIGYLVEPRVVVGTHAFYPGFMISGDKSRLIEVVGYMGDRYWDGTASKIKMMCREYPEVQAGVVTFIRIMRRRLGSSHRVTLFRPYEQVKLVRWCRGDCRGS